jgi:serine phosphatase RsbU (regulator of sigma subunit)
MIADEGTVGVLSPDGSRVRAWVVRGGDPPFHREVPLQETDVIATTTRAGGTAGSGALTLPVRVGGATVGALTFAVPTGTAIDADTEALARTLSELMGHALLRARLYEEERDAAHQLQRALLPEVPTTLPGVEVAGCYRPADRQHDVGGDWYDVFRLPGGLVGFVVGDVVGHDLGAAAAMGRLHAALRVLAAEPHDGPARVLEALDLVALDIQGATCATLGYAEYDPVSRRLRYACAGHPPPLLVIDHRPQYLLEGRSAPLAVTEDPRREAELEIPPGAMVLWYSDGLIESRHSDLDAGFDRLVSVAAAQDGDDPQAWCDAVIAELTRGHRLADDVVLLCVALRGVDLPVPAAPAWAEEPDPEPLSLN